ncbi:hypothetical protein BJ875DRAFT_113775 [Amylocarpus encephaloides]|uniref:BTB domain-containing protein n=1 Tax=Amylocarpus encephaloides TaxID=45428 RepID=A0A9P7YRD8_9HELO|nr:hypothetical protein BJ875DRAFT_113775 [Amylocarpus encephaloides]
MVKFRVGPDQKICRVHRNLVCCKVPYVKRLLDDDFDDGSTESKPLRLHVPCDPAVFGLFTDWLYGNLAPRQIIRKGDTDAWDSLLLYLIKCYMFAESIELPSLMDHVMLLLLSAYQHHDSVSGQADIRFVYEHGSPSSQLRKLMAYNFHWYVTRRGLYKTTFEEYDRMVHEVPGLSMDFLESLQEGVVSRRLWNGCQYHVGSCLEDECLLSSVGKGEMEKRYEVLGEDESGSE